MVKDANLINEIQENKKKCIKYSKTFPPKRPKISQNKHFSLYSGDLVTCKGDQEIQSIRGRPPDNLQEL